LVLIYPNQPMNLREIRKKIHSVSNIKKITHAMQMVSAVKMKKAQAVALEGRYYREALARIIGKLTDSIQEDYSPLLRKNEGEKTLVVVISSNKGLCGSFNYGLFRLISKKIKNLTDADYLTVGQKAVEFFNASNSHIAADFSSRRPIENVSAIFNFIVNKFLNNNYQKIYLAYNKFISSLKNDPVFDLFLPLEKELEITKSGQPTSIGNEEYLVEPNPKKVVDALLNSYLEERIREAIISSEASEHSSRMMAMKTATDNADELSYELTLTRNRLRQEKITLELLDMITAKESVSTN